MKRPDSSALLAVALLITCSLAAARGEASPARAQAQPTAQRPGALVFDLPVPGGLDSLFAATRVAPSPHAVALLSLIRILYAHAGTGADFRRLSEALESRVKSAPVGRSSDTVPLPLSPDVWTGTIFKGGVTPDRLVDAILRDKRASLLYYGLLSVDDATLAFFDAHRSLLAAIYDRGVGPFATCARSIHVRDQAVVLPGGPSAVPLWEAIVGERSAAPDRFVLSLVTGDQGRRAYFLDVITHLDSARQAFALAAAYPDRRNKIVRSLYEEAVNFESKFWRFDIWPFARLPLDPAIVLMQVAASPDGRMERPSGQAFWRAALDGNEAACGRLKPQDGEPAVDAAWLVTRLMREPPESRHVVLSSVLFAQRVFAAASDSEAGAACLVVAGFRRFSGLMLTLEATGFSAPNDYLGALRFAQALGAGTDSRTTLVGISQMQAILALLERVGAPSPDDRRTAQELVRSLCRLPSTTRPGAPAPDILAQREADAAAASARLDRLAEWTKDVLLRRLCRAGEPADDCLQEVAAGVRSNTPRPVIEWEGQRYRVDPASSSSLRLSLVRERQESVRFEWVLELLRVAVALRDQPFAQQTATAQAAVLQDLAGRLDPSAPMISGGTLESVQSALQRIARQLASARRKPPTAAADLFEASHGLLAAAWASFDYAMAIGDIDSSFLLADDPARHHDFDLAPAAPSDFAPAWQLAHEDWRSATGWKVKGSLLGLPRALALSWPRRLSDDPTTVRPTLDQTDAHGLAQSVAALNAFDLTDAGRSSVVAAIGRGRDLLKTAATDPDAFAARAAAIGVSEWRIRGAIWVARQDPSAVADLMTLVDLLWLGGPDTPPEQIDAWGVPAGRFDGSLAVRMPRGRAWEDLGGRGAGSLHAYVADLNLRAAIWLEEAKLPAALLPGVVSFATSDLTATAQPVDADDYLAIARAAQAIPANRFSDFVSALTTEGTLVPILKR